jgi:glycosyltransferase involved in cell wall biosynthesis
MKNMEVIICDDGSIDDTVKIVKSISDPRISIFTHESRKGMNKNYEQAIKLCKGEWIILMGQDDLMMPNCLSQINSIVERNQDIEVIVSSRGYYYWEDTKFKIHHPRLIVYKNNLLARKIKSKVRLTLTLLGLVSYNQGPQLYTGTAIKMNLVKRIKEMQGGIFFTYPIPDVSSSISILNLSSSYYRLYNSLFLIGTSKSSTGAKIEKLIDSNKDKILKEFEVTTKNRNIPGRGLTTNLQWYIVEASETIFKNEKNQRCNRLYLNKNYRLALIISSGLTKFQDTNFHKLYLEVNGKVKQSDVIEILIYTCCLKILFMLKSTLKYIYVLTLLLINKITIKFNVDERRINKILRDEEI